MKKNKERIIAFYLPQYHPIPENDRWWGKGFTEWTNVGKAKPLFKGHDQPKVPSDLGYYDLRISEVREEQAIMAKKAGIEGFCYWHYWFGNGKRLLEKPFNEVLESGKPDFPFCLGWANHSWKAKNWNASAHRGNDKLLIKQEYPGEEDYINHFNFLLKAFTDNRYIKVDDKPLFLIWDASDIPDFTYLSNLWNNLAIQNGLKGIYFISYCSNTKAVETSLKMGYDAVTLDLMFDSYWWSSDYKIQKWSYYLYSKLFKSLPYPRLINYKKYMQYCLSSYSLLPKEVIPCILPNYDHTPRSGKNGYVLVDTSAELFGTLLHETLKMVHSKENNLIFIKSWNEWGEGNYLEPDLNNKDSYLLAIEKQTKNQ